MKSFGDIFNSIKSDFKPQARNLLDIGVILAKAYSVLKNPKFERFSPFKIENEIIDIDRTTIERLIWEIEQVKTEDKGHYVVSSEGIERVVADIQTLNVYAINPSTDSHLLNLINFGKMKANLKYLIDISRTGLLFTRQKIIRDHLANLRNKDKRLNYLHDNLLNLKQNKKLWDKFQYDSMIEFIGLEINRWEKHLEGTSKPSFESTQQLYELIINLIQERLQHNIQYLEGYRIFWRDEQCKNDQKKENEIHHFIKSILKPYCDDLNIKIVRENAISNGRIDMTFTYLNFSICLEIKKAHHQDVMTAINTQLTKYMIGEETQFGIYLVLWYKSEDGFEQPKKFESLEELISKIEIKRDDYQYRILGIDCSKPISPSKQHE